MSIYLPHISHMAHGGLQFCKGPEGEIVLHRILAPIFVDGNRAEYWSLGHATN